MSPRSAALGGGTLAVVVALLLAPAALLGDPRDAGIVPVIIPLAVVGALVVARRPRNPVGWILSGQAFTIAFEIFALAYASEDGAPDGGRPLAGVALWLAAWLWAVGFAATAVLLPLLFPDGRLPSSRWRAVAWLAAVAVGLIAFGYGLKPGSYAQAPAYENPLGVDALAPGLSIAAAVGFALLLLAVPLALAGFVRRYHVSRGEQRQQLKWLAWAIVLCAVLNPLGALLWGLMDAEAVGQAASALGLVVLTAGVGIGILRHRLFDIDVVINRTLVYGALTALLGGTYVGLVLLLGLAVDPITESSGLAVAGSTLAVAALFRPARRRVQALVDRRFYRRRYDAAHTLAAFGARLRRQVDLDSVAVDLRGALEETVQPSHVSLWLRPTAVTPVVTLPGRSSSRKEER